MATYLDEIVAYHRELAGADAREESELEAAAAAGAPIRPFLSALVRPDGECAVIAEVKRRSPSRGDLAPNLDARAIANAYEKGGASCLSVLTDERYFAGAAADLVAARSAVGLPVLRKDFTVSRADLYDARAMGADAVLLIVAALSEAELADFLRLADRLALSALVEVHDEQELEVALRFGARLVGVNQRDLRTFAVDTERAVRLRGAIPDGVACVAESGIRTGADLARLADAGYTAALIGESLVTASDAAAELSHFLDAAARARVS